jgi:hypothetical protein
MYRIYQHFHHDGGAVWCYKNTPVEVIRMQKHTNMHQATLRERENTVEFMRTYGIRKVRGHDAVNCQRGCYRPEAIRFWVPIELREDALAGRLGEVDDVVVV